MGEYSEKRLAGLVRMKALQGDESSHVHRVRTSREVNDWFKGLTAEERGELVTSLYLTYTGVTPVISYTKNLDTHISDTQYPTRVTPVITLNHTETSPDDSDTTTGVTPVNQKRKTSTTRTGVTPVKLRGKALDLYNLLLEGGEMVAIGHEYGVVKEGKTVATFKGATGGALLTREGLLTETGPSRWVVTSQE